MIQLQLNSDAKTVIHASFQGPMSFFFLHQILDLYSTIKRHMVAYGINAFI